MKGHSDMTDTTTTTSPAKQLPLTTFNVHLYREMRLRFDGIKAVSPEQAAEKAREMHFDDAADWSDCEGESLSALVDVPGDDEFEQSRIIDFEPGRLLKAAPKLLEALEALSSLQVKGHALIDRLQFSEEGRALAVKIAAAIAEAKGLAA
jgi:hypothetical protein